MSITSWTRAHVQDWLIGIGLQEYARKFDEMDVDGETLLGLSDHMVGALMPDSLKNQVKFFKERKRLTVTSEIQQQESQSQRVQPKAPLGSSHPAGEQNANSTTCPDTNSDQEDTNHAQRTNSSAKASTSASAAADSIVNTHEDDLSSGEDISPSCSSQTHHAEQNKKYKEDHLDQYRLPTFPPAVKLILGTKTNPQDYLPNSANRRRVIECLTTDLQQRNKMHISKKGYKAMMDALFTAYPYLGDQFKWRESLRNKMKSLRTQLVSTGMVEYMREKYGRPGVSGRKRKIVDVPVDMSLAKRPKPQVEEPAAGLMDEDIQRHVQDLKLEAAKAQPDNVKVCKKLTKTAAYRLNLVYTEDLDSILTTFPILKNRSYLLAEARIQHQIEVKGKLQKLQQHLVELVKYTKHTRCRKFKIYYDEYTERVEETIDEKKKTDEAVELALKLLPSLFSEEERFVMVTGKENIPSPAPVIIKRAGKCQVVLDGKEILNAPTERFTHAVEAWFATFFAYGVQYPGRLEKTLLFLEKYVFDHNAKVPTRVVTWATKLGIQC